MPRLDDLAWPSSPMGRWVSGLVASAAMLGASTGIVALVEPPLYAPYLLVVLVVAAMWGKAPAMVIAVLSVAVYEYLFVAPLYPSGTTETRELVTAVVRLLTAVLVGQLAARLRQALRASARMNEEQSALRRVATLVAGSAPAPAVFEAVIREVGLLCGRRSRHMVRYEPDGTVIGVAAWSRQPRQLAVGTRLDLDGPSVAREVRQTGGPARIESYEGEAGAIARESRALGIRSSVGCPIQVTGRLWGVIAASTKSSRSLPGGHRVPDRQLHRARRHRHRERRSPRRADRLARTHRRHRRPDAPTARARPARRRPATAGLAGLWSCARCRQRCRLS